MWISNEQKNIMIQNSKFLLEKGYELEVDDYGITLSKEDCQIVAGFPPMCDVSEVGIRFIKENKYFDIGWIAAVRDHLIANCNDKLNGVIQLLKYIEENYQNITDLDYCLESRKLICEYIKKLKEK